jgi:DNA modification methylase
MMIRDRIKELRRVPAGELLPNPKNWRTHPQSQQDALRGVLAEIGYADALLTREVDGQRLMLIDGHLRAETTPDSIVPVLVLDVTDEEADKILATLDPLAAMAEADSAKLDALLLEVQTSSEGLAAMLTELAAANGVIPGGAPVPGQGGDEFDAEAALEGECRVASGDLWVIGEQRHRLLCGDSTRAEDVARVMGGEHPFLMVTDPPYGVDYNPEWRNEAAANGHLSYAAVRVGEVANDGRIDWTEAYRLVACSVAYVWHAGRHATQVASNLEAAGFIIRSQIIWAKPGFVISRGHYHWQHEPCWYAFREGESARWAGDRSQTTLWEITNKVNDEDKNNHGTQKPIECMARPMRNHGEPGDLVYDPFLGSGTSIIAAHRTGRRCCGIELEPRYCEVVLRRCEAEGLTVEKA